MRRRCLPALLVTASAACFQEFATDPPAAIRAIEHVSPPAVQVVAGGCPGFELFTHERIAFKEIQGMAVDFLVELLVKRIAPK